MIKSSNDFAEVIESSLHEWLAQSWQWNQFPHFGSLVVVSTNKRTLFGIVHQMQTGSMDPARYPFAYQKTEQELLAEQPQIFEFLKTTFNCMCVGYQEKGTIYYLLAPEPPTIHSFVGMPHIELAKQFFSNTAYLHLLFGLSGQIINMDELLLALLRYQKYLNALSTNKIHSFIESFCLLTGNDYRRLKLFLQRAQHIISI
ncbi:hypothetical protein KC460_04055 [Candidatus Dependentiae bacterium]|nr:hypothetical protein [Candidatus Dependentiae bacterium]